MTTTPSQSKIVSQGLPRVGAQAVTTGVISKSADASTYATENIFATLIRLGTAIGMGVYNFLGAKKDQKKAEKLSKAKEASSNAINTALRDIYEYGLSLIEQTNISPTDPNFEKLLASKIFAMTGYRGNCDADVFAPQAEVTGQATAEPAKRIPWFKIRNGRVTPEPGVVVPDNADTMWMVGCQNNQSRWVIAYRNKLIREGRQAELQKLESQFSAGKWGLRISFGLLGLIAAGVFLYNMSRMGDE